MANYSVTNGSSGGSGTQQNIGAAYVGGIITTTASSSPRRSKIYDVLVGTNGTPADTFVEWDITRVTTNNSATSYVALPLDPADAASLTTVTVNSTGGATVTVTADLWYVGVNSRASYRWVAAPGSELVWPATSSSGLVLRARGSATITGTGTVLYQEQ